MQGEVVAALGDVPVDPGRLRADVRAGVVLVEGLDGVVPQRGQSGGLGDGGLERLGQTVGAGEVAADVAKIWTRPVSWHEGRLSSSANDWLRCMVR